MHQRTLSLTLLAAVFLVIGDAVLQIAAVGALPATSAQWADLAKPEIVNALTFIVVMVVAGMSSISFAPIAGLVVSALVSNGMHRWIVGPGFTPLTMVVHIILFLLLGWMGLWLAAVFLGKKSSS